MSAAAGDAKAIAAVLELHSRFFGNEDEDTEAFAEIGQAVLDTLVSEEIQRRAMNEQDNEGS